MAERDWLRDWAQSTIEGHSITLRRPAQIVGRHERRFNGNPRAGVEVVAEPADDLTVIIGPEAQVQSRFGNTGFAEQAVFGVLDVLATAERTPAFKVRLTIVRLDIDPVNSSGHSCRMAGRAAGRRIIDAAMRPAR